MNVGDKVRLTREVKGLPEGLEGTVEGIESGTIFVRLLDAPTESVEALQSAEMLAPSCGASPAHPGAFPLYADELEVIE